MELNQTKLYNSLKLSDLWFQNVGTKHVNKIWNFLLKIMGMPGINENSGKQEIF